MAIPIEHEDVEELRKWGMGLEQIVEHCHFCAKPTRYWHARTNTPVCPECAKEHLVSELPNRQAKTRPRAADGAIAEAVRVVRDTK